MSDPTSSAPAVPSDVAPTDAAASSTPAPPAAAPVPSTPERSLAALPGVLASLGEPAEGSSRLLDLLRTASRHCRKLVDAKTARIWLARRSGRRMVARDFPDGEPPVELRLARGEGLVGWVVASSQPLRLGPGDERPAFRGRVPEFGSALVLPLFRRGKVFAAIECLDRRSADGAPAAFTAADQDLLEVASEHIAFALDHALLYEETERRALEKEMLLEVAKTLSAPLDLDEVLSAIYESLRQVVQFDGVAVYLVNKRSQVLEAVSCIGFPEGSEEAFRLHVGVGLVGWVAKTGEGVIVSDVRNDPRYVVSRVSTRSEMAAPLILNDRTIGVFNLESDQVDAYHEGHLELLSAFATQAAIAVERARLTRELLDRRRLEKELAIAREIQESFLPKAPPRIPGYDLAGSARSHHEVGGDYYDYIPISGGNLGLAIADVSGKGIPAALIMAGFRMCLLAEIRNDFAIRAVMRKVNSLLYESTERDKFVTAFYGVLDVKNRLLVFSNAGHNPPLIVRRDGSVDTLNEGGVALGVLPDAHYEERPLELRAGDVVVLYTDGVSEAVSPAGEQFGEERIQQCLLELLDRPAAAIVEGILEAVLAWSGEPGPADDLTLLVVKVLDQES
jgi:serine phosphatase RsbU (regulator of sigma subunit)